LTQPLGPDLKDLPPASPPRNSELEGRVIAGKYELLRLLGRGGMGVVYEGRHTATHKRCAVKLLLTPPELPRHRDLAKRFFREARAGSVIESDHVVEIFDSGSDPETTLPYIVMEFLTGEDLEQLGRRLRALEPLAAATIAFQASVGLAKAHAAGIIHRDIKPANLFLSRRDGGDSWVKILDFGIAKIKMEAFHETSTKLTRTGSLLGTPAYMSPEQCQGAQHIDARSDVWSLGVVLWELLTGGSPYPRASSLGSLMASIIADDLPLLQDHAPWVSPELAEITHRAMSRDLGKRYQDAGELRDALGRVLEPHGTALRPGRLVSVPTELRASVAPRLIFDDDVLRRTHRSMPPVSAAPPGRPRIALFGALSVAVLAALIGPVASRAREPASGAEAQGSASPVAPALAATSTAVTPAASAEAAPAPQTFELSVGPKGVEVQVDGVVAKVKNGRVSIQGFLATTQKIRLTHAGRSEERVVALTASGLVPDRLELAARAPRTDSVGLAPTAPSATAKQLPAPSAPAPKHAPSSQSDLAEGTDEFGK
jgi:eukaryotic-like serine/threonine-protein kinase